MFWSIEQASAKSSTFMPEAASQIATQVDSLYSFLVWASFISCVLVIGGMTYFAVKYRRRSANDKSAYISHNTTLEFLWSFIPFVIFMVVFAWGWWVYHQMRSMPKNAFEIHVTGQKWFWDFQYKSGRKTSGEFYAPLGEPVKLIMASRDVIHSFFIPGMRIKQDIVPGRYSALWFQADKAGTFNVFCTEYCGEGHSAMLGKVHVVPRDQFDQWLMNDPYKGLSVAQVGEKVYASKCIACHNVTTEKKIGPGFAGVFGKQRQFADGTSLVADENYIRNSILTPSAKVVAGFPNAMTPFQGQISEEELTGVIEYIKTLK
jgi:cytochrome c oxidase subunit II